jgi:hypothetical protein
MKTVRRLASYILTRTGVPVIIIALLLGAFPSRVGAQGCVASPNNRCSQLIPGEFTNTMASAHRWLGAVGYRWFESGRHFGGRSGGVFIDGDQENKDIERNNQQMINTVNLIDVSASYGFNARWSANLTIPFIQAERSSVFEHTDGRRHSMSSSGLGDLRLTTDFWLLDPHKHMNGNIALGIGFKAPSGDDEETDISYRATGPVYRPVDQSIQPGDGGWGFILQLQAYQQIYQNLFGYVQGSYLMAPKEQNDTQTVMGDLLPPGPATYNSISDQYFGRGGFSYLVWPGGGVTLSLGGRIEGVPVYDAIGGSLGYRQPGYTVSVEPGITWTGKRNSFSILAPVAVYRNRLRSAAEIEMGRPGGTASFADYSILASFSHRF